MTFSVKVKQQGAGYLLAAPCLRLGFLALALIGFFIALFNITGALANTSANKSAAVQNAEIYMRLEQLQAEVQELRNLVEIQANLLKENEASQRNRYLDLDQRAQEQAKKINKLEESQFSLPATSNTPSAALNKAKPVNINLGDKQVYDAAYQHVSDREFAKAITAFQNFINDYPNSNLIGNAYYWLGEIYLAQNSTQEAKKMFLAVTNNYPRSFKLADSKYKLGLIEARYGNKNLAKQLMQQLIDQHPNEPAADLAKAFLKSNS